jgi:hypothetical protein
MRLTRSAMVAAFVVALGIGVSAPGARAEAPSPWWGLTAGSRPTNTVSTVRKGRVELEASSALHADLHVRAAHGRSADLTNENIT